MVVEDFTFGFINIYVSYVTFSKRVWRYLQIESCAYMRWLFLIQLWKQGFVTIKKPVFFVMSPKIVDVLLDINIFEKKMWKNIRMNGTL